MARARGLKHFLMSENKGFISDQSSVAPVENSCTDESNVEFSSTLTGRNRRLGLNVEKTGKFIVPLAGATIKDAKNSYYWEAAGGEGSLAFHVLQMGQFLYFIKDVDAPLSDGIKNFSVDLNILKNSYSSIIDVQRTEIDFSDGNGVLFIVSTNMDPQYISFDPVTDLLTITSIPIRVRDLDGIEENLPVNVRPETNLTEVHEYNLINQGWGQVKKRTSDNTEVNTITEFNTIVTGKYPSNADLVNLGMVVNASGDLRFDASSILDLSLGNTPSPKGHFIINPFNIDYNGLRLKINIGGGEVDSVTRSGIASGGLSVPITNIPVPPLEPI